MTALNLFIADVYQDQKCLKDKVIPAELVLSRKEYMPAIIKYYLDQEPLLGQVPPTSACARTTSPTCVTISPRWW